MIASCLEYSFYTSSTVPSWGSGSSSNFCRPTLPPFGDIAHRSITSYPAIHQRVVSVLDRNRLSCLAAGGSAVDGVASSCGISVGLQEGDVVPLPRSQALRFRVDMFALFPRDARTVGLVAKRVVESRVVLAVRVPADQQAQERSCDDIAYVVSVVHRSG